MLIFRFTAALLLILAVSLVGIRLEKEELALKRSISLQQYRMDQLLEERARLRIRLHELTGPESLAETSSPQPEQKAVTEP
ncbi:MAG: hypothetical protein KDA93_05260 [Planctomycetaceae bacterium]|nr:hypothetical protein [Planctomycetaceae bacterium]